MQTDLTSSDVDVKLERALQRLQSAGQQVALDETRAEEQVQGVYESGPFPGAADCGAHVPVAYSVENLALDAALGDDPQLLDLPNNNITAPVTAFADQSGPDKVGDDADQEAEAEADYVGHVPTEQPMPPQLERRFWFVDRCENSAAAVQLLSNRSDGTFLIRPSTSNPNAPFTLSVVYVGTLIFN